MSSPQINLGAVLAGQTFPLNGLALHVDVTSPAFASTNTATTLALGLLDTQLQVAIGSASSRFGVRSVTLRLTNNTNETITALSLGAAETDVGAATPDPAPINYGAPESFPSAGIAAGDSAVVTWTLLGGNRRFLAVTATWTTAPTSGTIEGNADYLGSAAPSTGLAGSLVPQTLSPSPAPLAANATYTSNAVSMGAFDKIVGSVYANETGTLYINQSFDGTNWDVQSSITVDASTPTGFNISVVAPYAQVVYTNGGTAQTTFRLHVGGKTL